MAIGCPEGSAREGTQGEEEAEARRWAPPTSKGRRSAEQTEKVLLGRKQKLTEAGVARARAAPRVRVTEEVFWDRP